MEDEGPTRRELLPPRILVVEDDGLVSRSLRRALELSGYAVVTAGTAADAMAQIEAWPPHAILLDRGLPDMDGVLLAHAIRVRLGGHAPPIVMVTGDHGTHARGPVLACLHKPCDPRALLELVGSLTHRPTPGRPAQP